MAPSAAPVGISTKMKRPPGIQTSGINGSRTSSPSPSLSAGRLPPGVIHPPSAITSNGVGNISRSAKDRTRRDGPPQLLGRGQRNNSVGLRSASIVGESAVISEQPYVKTDNYILKKFRGYPPSLIIHLHPTNFRFDQQEGSFTYTSPMKIVLEHLRESTIPHDVLEFMPDVPFYEGCMIVQIHDHRSLAPSTETVKAKTGLGDSVPFSIHNSNQYLTPSPYVPYEANVPGKRGKDNEAGDSKMKSLEQQKDKENMPAPALPNDSQRKQIMAPKKKVYSRVLHPTPLSNFMDLANKGAETKLGADGRRESRQDANGPLSAIVPPTPTTAIPSTPLTSAPPPAKRLKKSKLDSVDTYGTESQIIFATTPALILEPASCAAESALILEALAHPMHAAKPPLPKTRKRTVAEMAADEAAAAQNERYMLFNDERLSSQAKGAQRSSNAADGSGQAGGVAFEARFERFNLLETIKTQHEESKRQEKLRKEEADRKAQQDQARNKLRDEAEKKEQDKLRGQQMQAAQAIQRQAHQQEAQRRAATQLAQQSMQGALQNQHAHPQGTGLASNAMATQPQRFHQQHVTSQNQTSSPIIRNGTPQSHSSPNVNNHMGNNIPMQQSTSSMGGSPARPGSVVHQNHPQMGVPAGHAMATQRSQQSHAGTPRMPPTPNVQSTPLNRPVQTPRMSQGSPLQGTVANTPQMPGMNQQTPMTSQAAQVAFHNQQQQRMMQMQMRNQQQQAAAAQQQAAMAAVQGIPMMPNGAQMTMQQQQQMMQQQMIRNQQMAQQQQLGLVQQGNPVYNPQMQQQMAAMAARSGNMPINQNFAANNQAMAGMPMNPNQMQHMAQMQQLRAQQAAAQQSLQQQHQGAHQGQAQPTTQQQMFQQHVRSQTAMLYNQHKNSYLATHPGPIPPEVDNSMKARCQQMAIQIVQSTYQKKRQEQMIAVQHQNNMNGMPNGMPNGMGM